MKALAAVLVVAAAIVVQADPAERFAESGDLTAAEREYRELLAEEPADPTLNYNLGTALLLAGRFEEARPFLERAAGANDSVAADSVFTGRAAYNLGNADLQPAFDDADLPDREKRLRQAIDAYRSALVAVPTDEDARWNLELARRLLEQDSPPPSEGGGGGGSGGGTGQGPPSPGDARPEPSPADGPGPEPEATRAEAEEFLDAARERELEVQRESLRKPQNEPMRP